MSDKVAIISAFMYNGHMKTTFIFDLYNTLIDVRTDEHCEAAWAPVVAYFKTLGINSEWTRLRELFVEYWRQFGKRARLSRDEWQECDCVDQLQFIAKNVGGDITREQAAEALCILRTGSRKWLRLFDGTLEMLDTLRSRGAKLYLLSNAQSVFTVKEIAEVGLQNSFDGILLSSDCGVRKPGRSFFRMLFDKFGLDKSCSVMVGDDLVSDGEGAKNFGIDYVYAGGGAAAHCDELYALLGE